MRHSLAQRRARFNRNKEHAETVVLSLRREKVGLSKAAAVVIQDACRTMNGRVEEKLNKALDMAEAQQQPPPPATPPRSVQKAAGVSPASPFATPATAKKPVPRVLSRPELAMQALGSRHGAAVSNLEEVMGYVENYPSFQNYNVQALVCSKHLDYNGRFVLLTWLISEGCSPVLVVELMLAAGSLKDQAAFDHVLSMLIALSKNQFEYRAYSRLTRSWHVARPAIGTASYWAEAIAKVRYARNYAPRS